MIEKLCGLGAAIDWTLFITLSELALTATLVVATIYLYRITKLTADAALRSAKASEKTISHAESTQRAYVTIKAGPNNINEALHLNSETIDDRPIPVELRISAFNTGNTRARVTAHKYGLTIGDLPTKPELLEDTEGNNGLIIDSGSELTFPSIVRIPSHQLELISKGHSQLWFYGEIGYLDIFDNQRTTSFLFFYLHLDGKFAQIGDKNFYRTN